MKIHEIADNFLSKKERKRRRQLLNEFGSRQVFKFQEFTILDVKDESRFCETSFQMKF